MIPTYKGEVPHLTTKQMIEVDRAMMEDYKIELIQMMENAGRNLAHLGRSRFFGGDARGKRVTVLAGSGGNGGGALVCARRLHNYGARVQIFLTRADESFKTVPAHQLEILRRMGLPIFTAETLTTTTPPDLIVDGIIGYSLSGPPRGTAALLIQWANKQEAAILSLDAPSGLDTTTGTVFDPAIQATATMTLALPKEGFRAPGAEDYLGELYLADISIPPELFAGPGLGIQVDHLFNKSDIIRIG